jgi:hypothetical protein
MTFAASAAAAKDADICLSARDIDHTTVPSDSEILFYMRDGKVWKNTLKRKCTGLHFEQAFREDITADAICSNRQVIQVANRETPCFLGTFTPYSKPAR